MKERCISRGDIYYATLDPVVGSEQGGTRPVLILQNNLGNLHSPTVIVAPIGLTGTIADDDPYAIQARISEIDTTIDNLIELEAKPGNEGMFESQYDALYGEKEQLAEKLARIKAEGAHRSAEQSRLGKIFTAVDSMKKLPLDWDEQIIRQMVECVKVMGKDKLVIRFRLGIETEVPLG